MPNLKAFLTTGDAFRRRLLLHIFPKLIKLPPGQWHNALEQARHCDFDTLERVALIIGVAGVTYLLEFAPNHEHPLLQLLAHVLVFFQALLLLVLVAGPIYLRRTRRGLDLTIKHIQNNCCAESKS